MIQGFKQAEMHYVAIRQEMTQKDKNPVSKARFFLKRFLNKNL